MIEKKRPDWVPEKAGKEFTTSVMKGVERNHDGLDDSQLNNRSQSK